MNLVRNPVWISCALKTNLARCMYISTPIYLGLRCSPTVDNQSLNILMLLSVLRLDWYFSSPFYRFFVWYLLTCHNDVIDAGHTNRLFVPGTDMDRERLRLSHKQNDTDNVQICDKYMYFFPPPPFFFANIVSISIVVCIWRSTNFNMTLTIVA